MKQSGWALILSGIAIIISIVAICVACPHNKDLGFDYQGVIVGVLSLLVTILIGWNIYSIIDMKNTKDKIEEISTGASLALQKSMAVSEGANWMIYHFLLLSNDPLGLEYRFIYHGIATLFHSSQFSDLATCNVTVKVLLDVLTNPSNITIPKIKKNEMLILLKDVRNPEKIEGFFELMEKVALIRVR